MIKYDVKKYDTDFTFYGDEPLIRGSREKKLVIDNDKNIAMFKYEKENYICSEACSEKIAYEIAKVLGFKCARIELAKDSEGKLGVLNYFFSDKYKSPHTDIVAFLNKQSKDRAYFYTISNIKKTLDEIDTNLFQSFIRIMIFDALIGEQDRHEENWGISEINGQYMISPLYDNGDSLLRDFKNENTIFLFENKIKSFDAYINKSKTWIYKEDNKKRYKHFELIKYLCSEYNEIVHNELKKLKNLSNEKITNIVNSIPDDMLTKLHKEYIIQYLIKRRDILLNI